MQSPGAITASALRRGKSNIIEVHRATGMFSAENLQRMAGLVFGEDLEFRLRGDGANWFVGWRDVR
jgi:putative heme degradation protein